jgi:hypothetical protein
MTRSWVSGSRFAARASACAAFVAALVGATGHTAQAAFHVAVIDEVLTSYNGDSNVQFVEMRMLAAFQSFVTNSVFAAFDANGTYTADIVVASHNLGKNGSDVRWLIGTQAFADMSGVAPDFVIAPGSLPGGGGMICYGGGGGIAPLNPPNWDRTSFANYVDCIAYGSYSGPKNFRIGNPTPLDPAGHSLQRGTNTHDNLSDFACSDTATPQNNAGDTADLPASSPCAGAETPTETVAATATPTATPTATSTLPNESPTPTPSTAVPTPLPCVADCNQNGTVSLDEVIHAVDIALGRGSIASCQSADPSGDGFPSIDELVRAVASATRGCS